MKPPTLETAYGVFFDYLHRNRQRYLVIGALAVGMLGEARLTRDLDFLLFLAPDTLDQFLRGAKRRGLALNFAAVRRMVEETGTLRLSYRGVPIDCLVASTPLEEQMWQRSKKLRLYGRTAHFPSPEDLILLKLLPGRPKDLLDAEGVLLRHKGRLDLSYLRKTAQRMADELQDARIWRRLKQLLSGLPLSSMPGFLKGMGAGEFREKRDRW